MDVVVLGLNHTTAPLEVREKLAFSRYPSDLYLKKLGEQGSVRAGFVLSTCNRVEVYASGDRAERLLEDAASFFRNFHELAPDELNRFCYSKVNREAVRHLFRVAASLDSMVVGEPQILGQVKDAYFAASACSLTDGFFDLLLQKTFSVAKRVRTETAVAQQAVSVSFAAVELAEKIFGELSEKSVLILGAGEMAEQAARHLRRREVREIVFTNRSYPHSVELSGQYGGIPVRYEDYEKYLAKSDIVIVSTAAPHYMIHRAQVEPLLSARHQEPMFFIDISVPRNVDPAINEIENVYLYNIDDLKGIVDGNLKARLQEADKAEGIIEAEVDQFFRSAGKLELSPTIVELQGKYRDLWRSEYERLAGRLTGASGADRAEIERAMETVVRKILIDPILFLKGDLDPGSMRDRAAVLRQVFRLTRTGPDES